MTRYTVRTLCSDDERSLSKIGRYAGLHAVSMKIANIHGLELDVRGRSPAVSAVIVTNHVSHLDVIAVATVLPVAPIAKSEVSFLLRTASGVRYEGQVCP